MTIIDSEQNKPSWQQLLKEGAKRSPLFDQIRELAQQGNTAALSRALESLKTDEVQI